jgi:hypothetical protein
VINFGNGIVHPVGVDATKPRAEATHFPMKVYTLSPLSGSPWTFSMVQPSALSCINIEFGKRFLFGSATTAFAFPFNR